MVESSAVPLLSLTKQRLHYLKLAVEHCVDLTDATEQTKAIVDRSVHLAKQ
jgi:hypothetical protein